MAPDLPPVKLAINELVRSGVHVVTLFSDVAGSMRETHVGADNRAAGRTAGLLLGAHGRRPPRDTLLLRSQATRLSAEIERRIGFAQVLEERFPKLQVLRTARPAGRRRRRRSRAAALPAQQGHRPGARRRHLQRRLGQRRRGARAREPGLAGSVPMVAHDLTDEHRALLGANGLAYVLHQDIHYCVSTARACCARCARTCAGHSTWCSRASRS